jgi:hypothetical protein
MGKHIVAAQDLFVFVEAFASAFVEAFAFFAVAAQTEIFEKDLVAVCIR